MKGKRRIIIAFALVIGVLAIWGIFRIWKAKEYSDITVTATVLSVNDAGQATRQRIQPKAAAEVLIGNSRQARPATFSNGILRTGFDHGIVEINGLIPAERIKQICPQSGVTEDWPFFVSFYNLSSGRVFHIYLDIEYDVLKDTAKADLYFFQDRQAAATVAHWSGRPGNPVFVFPERMEI